jgi:GNAT superfamily N-acetyltransferase
VKLEQNGYHEVPAGKVAAVVTYLEMSAPPPVRPLPDPPGLALRRVERPELAWYRDLYRRVGTDWLWFSRLVMPDEEVLAVIRDPAVEVYALESGGRAEGLLELDRREPPDVELAFFGLTAGLVGQGAGRWLMARALQLAWRHRPRRVWVHTCTLDHPAALAFYQRSGFVAYKRAVEIADDPRLLGLAPRDSAPWLPLIGEPQHPEQREPTRGCHTPATGL